MGRHRARREDLRRRLPYDPAEGPASDPLRLTPWRVLAGAVIPAVLLVFLFAVVATRWRQVAFFVVPPVAEIVLFLLAFAAWRPPRWVDRWHGRLLVVGAVMAGCATAGLVPVSVFVLVRVFTERAPRDLWEWVVFLGFFLAGPLLVATTRTYWRTADGLARRAFGTGPRLSRRALEKTFE